MILRVVALLPRLNEGNATSLGIGRKWGHVGSNVSGSLGFVCFSVCLVPPSWIGLQSGTSKQKMVWVVAGCMEYGDQ